MATNLTNYKLVGAPFTNGSEIRRARYDYANDGGATGTYNIFTADGDIIVKDFWAVVKTACGSGGSMTLDVGVTSDDDHLIAAQAVSGLTANTLFRALQVFTASGTADTSRIPFKLASGDSVTMDIDAATLTGGAIEFVIEVAKA